MVFESLVADLINKYLGDYVENLDKSQLKLGIWGGDVVLNELDVKESALDDLDLPVKIKAGHIGKLTLKIPWKNLYTEPVVATIDGLYALALPNVGIKYNAEKEEKEKQEAKQKKLRNLEEAKKLEAEKDKPKEKKQDSFAEKFATQVIKNLQVEVRNIHIRYEDRYTNPKHPFSIGITLGELLFRTTDEHWKPCIIKESVSQIFKLIKLEALAVYWNSNTDMYDGLERPDILATLKAQVLDPKKTGFQYLVRPISSVAHLRLNTKPDETEYKIPKIFLTVVFDEICVALAKKQYNDVLEMLEGFERVNLMGIYRKYKPSVPLKGHIKEWWHYAYNSILEETVRRRRRMWSWEHIKKHRDMKKQYKEGYLKKLDHKKIHADVERTIEECEKFLDVFNITILRQQAELELIKLGAKRAVEKKSSGWLGGWFGGGKKKAEAVEEKEDIQNQFYEQFTADEKAKLYEAIGYQENETDMTLPKEFVAVRLVTKLNNVSVLLRDETQKEPQLLKLQLRNVFTSVGQRPAASAVQVEAKIDKFAVIGTQQNEFVPRLVTSLTETGDTVYSLLDVQLETNPLDGLCDTRLRVNTRPVQIAYDAVTVNQLAGFFKPPQDIQLRQLSEAAMAKYEEIKEQSATGLQYAIEQKKYTDIAIDLKSSYVIVPHGGMLKKDVSKLVLDLGNLRVNTQKNRTSSDTGQQETLEEVMKKAYDTFNINLDRIQLLMAHPGEDWQSARVSGFSPLHILEPISIHVLLQKCMFDKDPRMPKMKVGGELPLLSLNISDHRLQEILSLAQSIPLPESAPPEPEDEFAKGPSSLPMLDVQESRLAQKATSYLGEEVKETKASQEHKESQDYMNLTDLELEFVIKEININVAQREKGEDIPLLKLVVDCVGVGLKMRTFDMQAEAYLGGIYLQYLKLKASVGGALVNLVNTPVPDDRDFRLLSVTYLKANKDGPEFATTYKKTEQNIDITFAQLELLLHLEAILGLMEFAKALQPPPTSSPIPLPDSTPSTISKAAGTEADKPTKAVKKKRKVEDPDVIDVQVTASLKMLSVSVCSEEKVITDIRIKGIDAGVTLQEDKTLVSALLKDITVCDPSVHTFYPKIMEIEGSEVLKFDMALYNNNTQGESYADMSCVDMKVDVALGRIKVVFLNKYVMDLLGFLNNFQAAQAKLKEAGDAMAELSYEAVQNLQETASRIALSVEMNAPVILVPQNSKSYSVLLVDFGHLELGNKFEMPGKHSASGIPAVVERMSITLTDLKVSRAIVDASGFVKAECEILEPVTVGIKMCRNLAASWFNDIPDIDISGTLEAIKVELSQGDFTTTMKVLNENLSEGQTPPAETKPAGETTVTETAITPAIAGVAESSPSGEATSSGKTTGEEEVKKPHCTLKFNFSIKQLSTTLYIADSNLTSGICRRDIDKALARVELQLIALDGHMMSNNNMDVSVILRDTLMDDLQPSKASGIVRLVERSRKPRTVPGDQRANMIDVSFKQDQKDKDINVHMSSLNICVCLDFLMTLADFFVKGMPDSAPPTPPPVQAAKDEVKEVKGKKEAAPPQEGVITIQVVIDKPEIIMIESQLNKSSNALAMDMELVFRMRLGPDTQDMSASIKGLEIASCKFDSRQSGAQILAPCDISFYSKTPKGQGAHMDISTTDLNLNISPATIRTMSGIAAGMSPQGEEKTEEEKISADLWAVKKLSECNLWFLKQVADPLEDIGTTVDDVLEERGEQMILRVPSIVIKIEGGVGNRTVPLLITEASFEGEVKDWSGKLYVESCLRLEVAYYNEKISVWEPLLEPVFHDGKFRRWELQLEVMKNDVLEAEIDEEDDAENIAVLPPKMTINVKSADALQLTMTKGCLEMLSNLGKAFGDAYMLVEPTTKAGEIMAPYVINNYTGLALMLKLDNAFEMPSDAVHSKVQLASNSSLPLSEKSNPALRRQASVIKANQDGDEKKMIFQVEQFGATREVTIKRAEKRLFHINNKTYPGDTWAIVCSTEPHAGQKKINFRSHIQLHNHLKMPMEVFYMHADKGMTSLGVMDCEKTMDVPLHAVYTPSGTFRFKPLAEGFETVSDEIKWRGSENFGSQQLSCKGQNGESPLYFMVCAELEDIFFEGGDTLAAKATTFHLHPTVILHNVLPTSVKIMLEGTAHYLEMDKGESLPLDHANVGKSSIEVTIPNYLGREWVGRRSLEANTPELSAWTFDSYLGKDKTSMDLGLHYKKENGSLKITVYSPYWMINKTGRKLTYRANDDEPVEHLPDVADVVMFSFKKSSFFGKKKASLKIAEADWSDKFSLDTVGSSGTVQSKSKARTYEVGVNIVLSYSGLTKIVTFTPYYMLVNSSTLPMECKEVMGESSWIEVPAKQCIPHWPLQSGKEMVMQAKYKDEELSTGPFSFNKAHTTLLRLDDKYGGINVECQETEAAMVTTLTQYKTGMAAVLLVNHTDRCPLNFNQNGSPTVHVLQPETTQLYSWEHSLGKLELMWSCGEKKDMKNDLSQDGIGEFFFNSDTKVYWVSFLDGMQRVLLFTHDLALATVAQAAGELERIDQEINLNITGLGLSLVNNYKQTEVAFLGITSSGIIWEEKRKRFKAFKLKTCKALEAAYDKFLLDIQAGKHVADKTHVEKMEVSFQNMMMTKPNKRQIRRSFQDGIWLQYKTSLHQVQFHAKVNRIQLDNQATHAVFQTVLSPMPPPKSVAAESVPKPFTEVSMVMRKHQHSNVSQMKYFKVLIQEMQVKVDQGFLNNLLELFSADQALTPEQEKELFESDVKLIAQDLQTAVGVSLAVKQKMFYDYLHLSPIKIHLSFSLQGGGGSEDGKTLQIQANVVNIFLQSVGVVLTDIQDVIFKLGYFERTHTFYNNSQLTSQMTRHYAGQAIKQMYVLVLGLDVLGNPFGLLRGMAEGIEDLFYEPYQGAIQGPGEFAEGLALGVRSLFGHAVGGAAGAVSRITGTLGKGIAVLTLDDEYQKKRREAMNKRPANVGEGFARGGKGLVMGVFDGVTGIVRKPIEGAQKEGVEGFFKGIGKGLVGVVTRPTSGVIDFASSSFEGIKRIAEMSSEIHRLRPPRRFHKDEVVRPYNLQEAEGCAVLQETDKGKFVKTDEYVGHVVVTKDGKNVFLATTKRLIFSSRGEIFGQWNVEWTYVWAELKEKPKVSARGIEIVLKEKEKKKFFGSGTAKKEVLISDKKLAERMVAKIQEIMEVYR